MNIRLRRARGFTLIELLVAISVLAIVAVMGWRGLDTIIRAREGLNRDLEQTRGLQLTFAQMQNDCDKIALPQAIGNRPVVDAGNGRLTLVRMVYAENQPSRVQVVSYRLQDGVLSRRESLPTRDVNLLAAAWTAALGDADPTPPVVLHRSVQNMNLRLWYQNVGWRQSGTPAPGNAPLIGVEVGLDLVERPGTMFKIFMLGNA
ncbi:MAG TPA: prepilin-type N-terminal cleavage/methylation domain-containing protein [Noviherbaspirillum sp.]|nr:prepilin-type N-terminal cleavage/methylation domain-containing protein [Noviherbaspirillum sp.]